jgi:hypothetical protein
VAEEKEDNTTTCQDCSCNDYPDLMESQAHVDYPLSLESFGGICSL